MTVIESHERWMVFKLKIWSFVLQARFSGVHILLGPLTLSPVAHEHKVLIWVFLDQINISSAIAQISPFFHAAN